ncbi:MAG: HD domain-containing protein [Pseudomonadota bacterium]
MITTHDIEVLFGDLLDVMDDPTLRRQVVQAWVAGCAAGGWESLEALRAMPFTLLTDCHGVSFVEHTRAVTAGALALGRAQLENYARMPYALNLDYLVAGGLLHDVGKLMEIGPNGQGGYKKTHAGRCARHPISGAILAAQHGVPQEVLNIVICHAKEGDGRPQRLEAILVHQADFATFDPLVMMKKGDLILEGEA